MVADSLCIWQGGTLTRTLQTLLCFAFRSLKNLNNLLSKNPPRKRITHAARYAGDTCLQESVVLDVSVPTMKVCSIAGLLGRRERDASVTTVVWCGGRPDWAKKLNKKN